MLRLKRRSKIAIAIVAFAAIAFVVYLLESERPCTIHFVNETEGEVNRISFKSPVHQVDVPDLLPGSTFSFDVPQTALDDFVLAYRTTSGREDLHIRCRSSQINSDPAFKWSKFTARAKDDGFRLGLEYVKT